MEKRQRFTAEYKHEAIRLMRTSGKPVAVVARELGIPRNRLYKWAQSSNGVRFTYRKLDNSEWPFKWPKK